MSMVYCWHAPKTGVMKFGYTTTDRPQGNMRNYAMLHGLEKDYDRHSLIMLHCPDPECMEKFAHLVLEGAGLPRLAANRELFLLGDLDYYTAAYLIMWACQRNMWLMTGEEPWTAMKGKKAFADCNDFPRHVPAYLKFKFNIVTTTLVDVLETQALAEYQNEDEDEDED